MTKARWGSEHQLAARSSQLVACGRRLMLAAAARGRRQQFAPFPERTLLYRDAPILHSVPGPRISARLSQ